MSTVPLPSSSEASPSSNGSASSHDSASSNGSALRVVPPRAASNRDLPALETTMHGLALDTRTPVALEIVGTQASRQFVLRSRSPEGLVHLTEQVRARYPQAEIRDLLPGEDALRLDEEEEASIVELEAGSAPYLPLKTWKEREWQAEGSDPILGILAALAHLPARTRAITQLALVPASPTWSESFLRKAQEHPLEPERRDERKQGLRGRSLSYAPSAPMLISLGVLVAVLLLWRLYARQITRIVPWVGHDLALLLSGKIPTLAPFEVAQIIGALGVVLLVVFLVSRLFGLGRTPIYDMRLVGEKTKRIAYRGRLRLIVIGPVEACKKPALRQAALAVLSACVDRALRKSSWGSLWVVLSDEWQREWRAFAYQRAQARERNAVLGQLIAAYRQYHQAAGGYFVPKQYSARKARRIILSKGGLLLRWLWGWQRGVRRSKHYLSVAEVAALWHLPQVLDLPDLALVTRGRARTLLAPEELTRGDGWRIGFSEHGGYRLPVYLPAACRRQNMLSVASTGKGKSSLFQHVAQAHLAQVCAELEAHQDRSRRLPESLFFIEPHGDTVGNLAGLIPPLLYDHVVVLDLANSANPPAINGIDMTMGRNRDKAVDNLISIYKSIWDTSWGPRTENVLEFSLKTLSDANERIVARDPEQQYTLLDVVPLLRNHSFRHAVLSDVCDQTLLQWWEQYYEPMDPRFQTEVISSVVNKMSKYAGSRIARRLLGQPTSSVNMSEIIRDGTVVLISTASGVVGDEISSLVGATLLGLFQASMQEQAQYRYDQRTRYLTLIDEFQVYAGARYSSMLGELRKFGGTFGLATQSLAYLDRLDRTLRPTVMSNIDHLYAFDMSAEDARILSYELDSVEVEDIINLDDFQCYAKLSLGGQRLSTFSLRLERPEDGHPATAELVRRQSGERHTRSVQEVDTQLARIAQTRKLQVDRARRSRKPTPGPAAQQEEESSPTAQPGNQKQTRRGTYGAKGKRKKEPPLTTPDGATTLSRPLIHENLEERDAGETEQIS